MKQKCLLQKKHRYRRITSILKYCSQKCHPILSHFPLYYIDDVNSFKLFRPLKIGYMKEFLILVFGTCHDVCATA